MNNKPQPHPGIKPPHERPANPAQDPVEEASLESFPSSDSPAWSTQEKNNKQKNYSRKDTC